MAVRPEEIASIIRQQIEQFGAGITAVDVGSVWGSGDGVGRVKSDKPRPVERIAPNVVMRQSVNTSVHTGVKAIDAMVPIGRGQRELIIGDRFTGKTTICLDTIIAQKGGDVTCIYVAIGQQASKVAQNVAILEESGAMEHTVVVAANAADPAALQYLAPYAGCAG